MKAKNLLNQRIGILTVIEKTNKTKYKKPSTVWLCKCKCGNFKEYSTVELLGTVRSCGCLKKKYMDTFGEQNKGKTPTTALPPGESTMRCLYKRYQISASKRGIAFELDQNTFRELVFTECVYCGCPPTQIMKDCHRPEGDIVYNGIDRTDNSKGYAKDNCVPCCKICNRAKDTMSQGEFVEWIKRVYQKQVDSGSPPVSSSADL
jgi:5-methylcytosine-specific restriction endonuclease McrA